MDIMNTLFIERQLFKHFVNRKICEDPKTSAFNKRESSIVVAKAYRAKAELLDVGPTNNAIRLMPKQVNAVLLDSIDEDGKDSDKQEG
jgi:hypothetical protein